MGRHPLLQRDSPKIYLPTNRSEDEQSLKAEATTDTEDVTVTADAPKSEAEEGSPSRRKCPASSEAEAGASSSEFEPAKAMDVPRAANQPAPQFEHDPRYAPALFLPPRPLESSNAERDGDDNDQTSIAPEFPVLDQGNDADDEGEHHNPNNAETDTESTWDVSETPETDEEYRARMLAAFQMWKPRPTVYMPGSPPR